MFLLHGSPFLPTKKVSLQSPWCPPTKTVTSMFTMSPSSKGLVDIIKVFGIFSICRFSGLYSFVKKGREGVTLGLGCHDKPHCLQKYRQILEIPCNIHKLYLWNIKNMSEEKLMAGHTCSLMVMGRHLH